MIFHAMFQGLTFPRSRVRSLYFQYNYIMKTFERGKYPQGALLILKQIMQCADYAVRGLCRMQIMPYADYAVCRLCRMQIIQYANYVACVLCIMCIMCIMRIMSDVRETARSRNWNAPCTDYLILCL